MGEKKKIRSKRLIKSPTSTVPDPRRVSRSRHVVRSPLQVWFELAGKLGLGSVGDRRGAEVCTGRMKFGPLENASYDEMNSHSLSIQFSLEN